MKILTCTKCRKEKKEIEFEYFYFQREYSRTCKECDNKKAKEKKNEPPEII